LANKDALVPAEGKAGKSDEDLELEGLMSEIESDLREEELKKLWKRHGNLIIAAAVALVLGVLAVQLYRQYEARERTSVAQRYDQATHYLDDGKLDEALAGYKAIEAERFAGGFKTLAQLGEGAALLKKNDEAGAVKVYAAIAADQSADSVYRDLATVLRVLHSVDTGDAKALEATLAPLLNPANPYHASATELTAVLAAKQGETTRAHQLALQLAADPQTPSNMRQRATDLAALYKGPETEKPAAPAAPEAAKPDQPVPVKPEPTPAATPQPAKPK